MQHLLLKCADGSVIIMVADDGVECEAEIAKCHPDVQATIIGHEVLDYEATHAMDRYFRNAWTHVTKTKSVGQVAIDMEKAREIHRETLRTARAPLLVAADVEYMRADEAGDEPRKADVRAYKQDLRDVTADPRIAAAKTPEVLMAVIPETLDVAAVREYISRRARPRPL